MLEKRYVRFMGQRIVLYVAYWIYFYKATTYQLVGRWQFDSYTYGWSFISSWYLRCMLKLETTSTQNMQRYIVKQYYTYNLYADIMTFSIYVLRREHTVNMGVFWFHRIKIRRYIRPFSSIFGWGSPSSNVT